MQPIVTGIHHVTAFAKDPTENIAFYTNALGLRLVKRTVNFDDPFMWHMYYADELGTPGTVLTHFPDPRMKAVIHGAPEIRETVLAVPMGSLASWRERLRTHEISTEDDERFGDSILRFTDPHGMRLALVERQDATIGTLPIDHATIHLHDVSETALFLRTAMGFEEGSTENGRTRLSLENRPVLELVEDPSASHTKLGAGGVHHVAFRVPSEEAQADVGNVLRSAGVPVTEQKDRQYFRSTYARIPGGVIFEFATDGPGFDADEPARTMGQAFMLPPQYESRRAEIERRLPVIDWKALGSASGAAT